MNYKLEKIGKHKMTRFLLLLLMGWWVGALFVSKAIHFSDGYVTLVALFVIFLFHEIEEMRR
jgi:formate/nitrite transporter FocA (FNT family)